MYFLYKEPSEVSIDTNNILLVDVEMPNHVEYAPDNVREDMKQYMSS